MGLVRWHNDATAFDHCNSRSGNPGVSLFVLGSSLHNRPYLGETRPKILRAKRSGSMQSQMQPGIG
jgi:hypothetical protein